MHPAEIVYYAKKAFAIFPGGDEPISAPVFATHYQRLKKRRSKTRKFVDRLLAKAFKAWLPRRTRRVATKYGKDKDWQHRTLSIAQARFVDPNDIALFRIERAEELDCYIRRFEDAGFNKAINPMGWSRDCVLVDKAAFYRRCREYDLPHPTVFGIVENGKLRDFVSPSGEPLLVKPTHGEGGRGVARLPEALSDMENEATFAYSLQPFIDNKQVWIVQRALRNHPVLANYAMDALATVRLTTMRNERREPELVSTVLRVPSLHGPIIDNMKAGGLIMPLDFETGRAGIACKGYGGGDYARHPVSDAAFSDLVLPDWDEARELVADAHKRGFPEYALVGWDVAFTPTGPMLVEGNAKPGVLMPQRSGRRGLASQRYGELLALNLDRAEKARGVR